MRLTDKEKLNCITQYFYGGSFNYENDLINAQNQCNLHTDKFNIIELYKCQVAKDTFIQISKDIEKILFD